MPRPPVGTEGKNLQWLICKEVSSFSQCKILVYQIKVSFILPGTFFYHLKVGGFVKIGYARVSTRDQNLDLQIDALKKAVCTDTYIYKEKISGASRERQELQKMLSQIREGDVVVIWKLDRLGRSLADLVHLVN